MILSISAPLLSLSQLPGVTKPAKLGKPAKQEKLVENRFATVDRSVFPKNQPSGETGPVFMKTSRFLLVL
jgi:hypothetical protein